MTSVREENHFEKGKRPMIKHIFLDIDGVLANFYKGVAELFEIPEAMLLRVHPIGDYNIEKALCKVTSLTMKEAKAEMWRRITLAGPQFWVRLKTYSWGMRLYNLCGFLVDTPVTLVTQPAICAESSYGKVQWIQEHFGLNFRDYLITPGNKYLLANEESVLIDDSDSNIDKFTNAGGFGILFPPPWNRQGVLQLDMNAESRIRFVDEALQLLLRC